MYAAHHDQPTTIAYLLRRGADTSIAIKASRECGHNISTSGRTALTYALENGGLQTITLLLTDAMNKKLPLPGIAQEALNKNTKLSRDEVAAISAQLSQMAQYVN